MKPSTSLGPLPALIALLVAAACGSHESVPAAVGEPRRIVAIAPAAAEMLFELGLGSRVVGVGDYVAWPPAAATLPRLGGLFDARIEQIAQLDPDLAVLLPSEERLRDQLTELEIEVLTVPSDTLEDVERMAILIGQRCGVAESAQRFVERWRRELAPTTGLPSLQVLVSVNRAPGRLSDLLVSGPGTFLDELLTRLGVVNSMADAGLPYPQIGLEEVVTRSPDVVLELQAAPGTYDRLVADWQGLGPDSPLAGVCVRVLAGDHVLLPGPRVPRLYRDMREAVAACEQSGE